MAILATEIGNLDNSAQENKTSKMLGRGFPCFGMQAFLVPASNCEQLGTNVIVHVRGQLRDFKTLSQMNSQPGREIVGFSWLQQAYWQDLAAAIR